jgi:large subunit ribosomal protein L29
LLFAAGERGLLGGDRMKARDLREMTDDQLQEALAERRQELFNLRFQSATGALENPARLKLAKREIARILTVRSERELAQEGSN